MNPKETGKPDANQNQDPKDEGQNKNVPKEEEQETKPKTEENQPEVDESGWDDKTKGYIKKLRSESAKYRTEAKDLKSQFGALNEKFGKLEGGLKTALGIEDGSKLSPEEAAKEQGQTIDTLEMKLAVRDLAIEQGVTGDGAVDYLEFLIQKEAADLDENEELGEEKMTAILGQVKKAFPGGVAKPGATSVGGNNETKPAPGGEGDVTLDSFSKMTVSEKSLIFQKNPTLYNSLMQQSKEKQLIS